MTVTAPEDSGGPLGPDPDGAATEDAVVVRRTVRQRTAQRRRRRRRLVLLQAGVTLVFLVALVALSLVGWRSALRITGGGGESVTDPDAPGYVAAVRPTPVTLLALTAPDVPTGDPVGRTWLADVEPGSDQLASMVLVVDSSDGTEVVPMSPDTLLWEFEGAPAASAHEVFASGGIDVLRLRLGSDLTFGPTATAEVSVSVVEELAARVGPITVELPDDVLAIGFDGQEFVRWGAGPLTLQPEEVAEFLGFVGHREPGPNQALRASLVWSALLDPDTSPPVAGGIDVDGESAAASDALEAMLDGEVRVDPLPLAEVPLLADPPRSAYRVDTASMPRWVATHVPFPTSAFPGQRARVEVLNGTTVEGAVATISPQIVEAGGAITLTGNAESFDVATTRVTYASADASGSAERIAAALGTSAQLDDTTDTDADVVVVVGADRAGT